MLRTLARVAARPCGNVAKNWHDMPVLRRTTHNKARIMSGTRTLMHEQDVHAYKFDCELAYERKGASP